jgi:hypothetical protein
VCKECDIELNGLGLKWAYPETYKKKLAAYIKRSTERDQNDEL